MTFKETIQAFHKESMDLKMKQAAMQADNDLFNQKLAAFLKEQGLPETFTVPELALLIINKTESKVDLLRA